MYRESRGGERAAYIAAASVAAGVAVAADTAAVAAAAGCMAVVAGVVSARRNGLVVTTDHLVIYSPIARTLRIQASSISEVRVVPRRNFVTEVVGTPSGVAAVVVTYDGEKQLNIESKTPNALARAIDATRSGCR